MTGNQIKGKGFRGALRYNLEKVEKGVAEILDYSFASTAEKIIMKEVQMVKVLRPNLHKYFYHTSINFPPGENLPNEKMKQIAFDYLQANGFTQHQFIMFRHYDADHPHLHILVNRIGYDGKVLSDSNDYQRSETILRDLEVKYNLTRVTPSRQASDRAFTKNEFEMIKRLNTPSQKMKLQKIIKRVLTEKPGMTIQQFVKVLESKGVNIIFNQASTGFVSGISYSYEGFITKGAKLGNDFKWTTIKNRIDYEQERDRGTIQETNIRNKATGPVTATKTLKQDSVIDRGGQSTHRHKLKTDPSLFEIGTDFDPITLLNSHTRRDEDQQPDQDNAMIQRMRKKRRKGRRL